MKSEEIDFWMVLIAAIFTTLFCWAMFPMAETPTQQFGMVFIIGLVSGFWIAVGYHLRILEE